MTITICGLFQIESYIGLCMIFFTKIKWSVLANDCWLSPIKKWQNTYDLSFTNNHISVACKSHIHITILYSKPWQEINKSAVFIFSSSSRNFLDEIPNGVIRPPSLNNSIFHFVYIHTCIYWYFNINDVIHFKK